MHKYYTVLKRYIIQPFLYWLAYLHGKRTKSPMDIIPPDKIQVHASTLYTFLKYNTYVGLAHLFTLAPIL